MTTHSFHVRVTDLNVDVYEIAVTDDDLEPGETHAEAAERMARERADGRIPGDITATTEREVEAQLRSTEA